MAAPDFTKIDHWLEQASKEIILSEPGTDQSQFPLRDLFSNLTTKSEGIDTLREFHRCAAFATEFVENLMFSGQSYTESHLVTLGQLAEEITQLREDPARLFNQPIEAGETSTELAVVELLPFEDLPSEAESLVKIDLMADGELLREFAIEGREHLDNIEQGVLVLEEQPDDADTLNSIFRAFHTFKGGSGFLHLGAVNRLSHELESLLDSAREGRIRITSPIINLILEGGDILKVFVNELQLQLDCQKPVAPISVPGDSLILRVREVIKNNGVTPEVCSQNPKALQLIEPGAVPNGSSQSSEPSPNSGSSVIKVDTRKFDGLVDLVGELVIAQSLVSQNPEMLGMSDPQLTRNLSQLHRITNELQKTAMSLRMMPIRGTFQKMHRLVRDLTARNHKEVNLIILGEETEMDRTIVEELGDPLMHMIRNSVDHGIESPEARVQAGKPRIGRIELSASHQGGNIVIEITDDGAGLSTQKLLAKALERNLISEGAQLSDKEIFNLIFAAGFSTADKITDISGRGVGMDVVKRNITKLRGKIEIESVLGRGTTFKIYLPLTLAIIDGLVVRVGEERYVIPTLSVRESFRPTPEMFSSVGASGELLNVRGKLRPVLRLYEFFGVKPRTTNPMDALMIVVESARRERCIMVDDLLGKQEVVIKSLGDRFKNNKALAGAAILGDGRVGLILDPRALVFIENTRDAA